MLLQRANRENSLAFGRYAAYVDPIGASIIPGRLKFGRSVNHCIVRDGMNDDTFI